MFTGLVEAIGYIANVEPQGADRRLRIEPGALANELAAGDSIAIGGACLTVTEPDVGGFWADVSVETLDHTTLGDRVAGDAVNLERPLLPTTRMGGHFVAGHVDGVGEVTRRTQDGRSVRLRVRVPRELARYVAPKGSICIDGVSLTVNEVERDEFGVNIIPHTLEQTTLGELAPGSRVNIEVDLLARYLERLRTAEDDMSVNRP